MDPSRKVSVNSDMGSRFGSNDRSISNSYRIIEPDKSYRNDPENQDEHHSDFEPEDNPL